MISKLKLPQSEEAVINLKLKNSQQNLLKTVFLKKVFSDKCRRLNSK